MKERCLFCDEILGVDVKNLIASFDCLEHGWYSVNERIRHSEELRAWALKSSQDLIPIIQHHNRSTGRAYAIPDHWVGRKVNVHFTDTGASGTTPAP
jgi:hypothetical protein